MKAVAYDRYGGAEQLELRELPEPTPGAGEVLVRVHAAGVGAGDWHLLRATWFLVRLYQGLLRPKRRVLGHELSGVVEAIGSGTTRFRPGDAVFGSAESAGAFAELVAVNESHLAPKPESATHVEAAAVPVSAQAALQGLRDHGAIRAGMRVLIVGASGGVGTWAVQLAKHFDTHVTAVCSTSKVDTARALGADRVVDYTREDVDALGERWDLVLDVVGKRSFRACRALLTPEGRYVAVSGHPLRGLALALFGGRRLRAYVSTAKRADLELLADLLDRGAIRPVIEQVVPLEETPRALTHVGAGHAAGKTVILVRAES